MKLSRILFFSMPSLSVVLVCCFGADGVALAAAAAGAVQPSPQSASSQVQPKAALAANYGKLPLSFEANQGQVDPRVRFTSRGDGYSLFLTDKEAVLSLSRKSGQRASEPTSQLLPLKAKEGSPARDALKTDVVRMQLAGASSGLKVEGEEKLPGTANYFIGRDPAKWRANVPTYSKVKYAGVYPGVDLVYYGNQRQLEYDFVVAPGADPKQVKLHFAGVERLKLNSDGDLMVTAKDGEIAFHKPVVYQMKDGQLEAGQQGSESAGQRELVEGKFRLLAKNTVGFTLGGYDRSRAVVIDPVLAYSTYLGGNGKDHTGDASDGTAVDAAGNVYIAGPVGSDDFPVTAGAFQTIYAPLSGSNSFIAKLNSSGSGLVYATYLSGAYVTGIAVDGSGDAYVTGVASDYFPVTGDAFQKTSGGSSNPFVTKLNATGSALVYSTYLGGSGGYINDFLTESGSGIAVDSSGNAYVAGQTNESDFPVTPDAFQKTRSGPSNGFVSKLNASGSGLIYSTYLGGSGSFNEDTEMYYGDACTGIAIDAAGDAYVTGSTGSADFPVTAGAFQATNRSQDPGTNAFVTKLNPEGSALIYSTYLGGSNDRVDFSVIGHLYEDAATGIALDRAGDAYVTGYTGSTNFPVTSGTVFSYGTSFVTKLNPAGTGLVYSTLFPPVFPVGIAVDVSGNAYIGGTTYAFLPVTPDAFQSTLKGKSPANPFLMVLNGDATALVYSTYLGGDDSANYGWDAGTGGIALDSSRNAYISGTAFSTDFPVTDGAFQIVNHAAGHHSADAFVAKFSFATSSIDFDKGFAEVSGIQLNGSSVVNGSHLRLTDGGKFEAASAFYMTPVNVKSFVTNFTFQLTDPNADGIAFVLQNTGPGALGNYGGALGYAPTGASVAVKFDLHNNAGEGINSTGLYLNGASPTTPALDLTGTGIDLHSGHIFNGYLSYDGKNLYLTINDLETKAEWKHLFTIDIPSIVGGDTAYAGFTGGTGAETATQEILSWGYVVRTP